MFRNNFDTDCITWSPAGRIHQIEYAMEAVKQGAATVGLRSNKHVVVATVKRASSELGSHVGREEPTWTKLSFELAELRQRSLCRQAGPEGLGVGGCEASTAAAAR